MVTYSALDKCLSSNPDLAKIIYSVSNAKYLTYLDGIFNDLLIGDCKGVDVKVAEISDISRFPALLSELKFANFFGKKKWAVELLPSDIFQNKKAPDMLVKNGRKEFYVEVKNIQYSEESHDFGIKVADFLNNKGLQYMVNLKTSKILSNPAFKYQTKDRKEELYKKAYAEFESEFQKNPLKNQKSEIKTSDIDISFIPTTYGKSFLGISAMKEAISELPEYAERIRYDIVSKTSKREDWQNTDLEKLYLIAIDDENPMCYIDRYNVELFGEASYFIPPLPVPQPTITPEISTAISLGWKDYLVKMCILQNGRSVIQDSKRGLLFKEPVLQNMTGLIVMHDLQFFLITNPFADIKINDNKVLNDLSDCITGWE